MFKNDILKNVGLDEGLIIFKNSKRLKKYAYQIDKKNTNNNQELNKLSSKIREMAVQFETIENRYGDDKIKAKKEYDQLRTKYKEVLDGLNNKRIIKFFIIGLPVVLAGIFATDFLISKSSEISMMNEFRGLLERNQAEAEAILKLLKKVEEMKNNLQGSSNNGV